MRRALFGLVVALLLVGCAPGQRSTAPDALGLRELAELPLPGDTSRWDDQSLDTTTGRLYLAHLGVSSMIVSIPRASKGCAGRLLRP